MSYTKSKSSFPCLGKELQILKYPPFELMLCIKPYRIIFMYQKLELQSNIAYLAQKVIMILQHLYIFIRKTTPESQRCCNVNTTSKSQYWKHNVVATLVFGRSNIIRNTTLWQHYPMSQPKYNQNPTSGVSWIPKCWVIFCMSSL